MAERSASLVKHASSEGLAVRIYSHDIERDHYVLLLGGFGVKKAATKSQSSRVWTKHL